MIKVGITGGIGSGKSIVCKIFNELGIPIYEADKRAKTIILEPVVKNEVIKHFGEEAYLEDKLNRDFIAKIIFDDFNKRELLNSIIHPAVSTDYNNWCYNHQQAPYLIKEAALFFETGSYLAMDKMILVTADYQLKIDRIKKRDPFRSEEEILKIMASQLPDEEKIREADFVVLNNENDLLLPQINKIHKKILLLVNQDRDTCHETS